MLLCKDENAENKNFVTVGKTWKEYCCVQSAVWNYKPVNKQIRIITSFTFFERADM